MRVKINDAAGHKIPAAVDDLIRLTAAVICIRIGLFKDDLVFFDVCCFQSLFLRVFTGDSCGTDCCGCCDNSYDCCECDK